MWRIKQIRLRSWLIRSKKVSKQRVYFLIFDKGCAFWKDLLKRVRIILRLRYLNFLFLFHPNSLFIFGNIGILRLGRQIANFIMQYYLEKNCIKIYLLEIYNTISYNSLSFSHLYLIVVNIYWYANLVKRKCYIC